MPKVTVNDLDIYYKIPDMLLVPDPYHVTHKYHPFMRPEPLPTSDIDRISLVPLIGAANAALALFDRLFRSITRISSSPRLSCRKPSYHPG